MDIGIDWYALFDGRVDAEITLLRPNIPYNAFIEASSHGAVNAGDWRREPERSASR